jgi:hypothetical protein
MGFVCMGLDDNSNDEGTGNTRISNSVSSLQLSAVLQSYLTILTIITSITTLLSNNRSIRLILPEVKIILHTL